MQHLGVRAGIVLASGLAFPEGPAFAPDGALWCVALKGGALARIADGKADLKPVGGAPNGLAFDEAGRGWFCDAERNAIRMIDIATGETETVVSASDAHDLRGPNDLAFAPDGSLVFTCPGNSRQEPTGMVWHLSLAKRLTAVADGLYFPNGLAFDQAGNLVIAETYRHRLWRGTWDGARWRDAAPFADVGGPNGPDGMAFGGDGLLRVAVYGQQAVKIVAANGEIVGIIETPGRNPTNCAFDPSGRLGLVVTEAERGEVLSYPDAGKGLTLHG